MVPVWLSGVGQWILDKLLPPVVGELFKRRHREGQPPRETIRAYCERADWSEGSIGDQPAMQFVSDWRLTNITNRPIEIWTARPRLPLRFRGLIPWLPRPILMGEWITVRHPRSELHSSQHPILPYATSEARAVFWIRPPFRKPREDIVLDMFLVDQFGNAHRTRRVCFRGPPLPKADPAPSLEALHSLSSQLEKDAASVLKNELTRYRVHGRPSGGLGSVGVGNRGGIPTEFHRLNVIEEQLLEVTALAEAIESDNVTALLNRYSRLATDDEREDFRGFLLARLSRATEYAPVGYLTMLFFFRIGRLGEALDKAKQDLMGDSKYGFSDLLRLLDVMLRYEHNTVTEDQLDTIERFLEDITEHTFRIRERLAAIRAGRLRSAPPCSS